MPGFFVSNVNTTMQLRDLYEKKCISDQLSLPNEGIVARQTLNKFLYDKAFSETEDLIVIMEGYLLNKVELLKNYNISSISELVEKMYKICGEQFFKEFRGCFSGAVFRKADRKWIVFTNQIGDNPVFFLYKDGIFAAGSQVQYLLDFCRDKGIVLSFNEECAYQMLTYGYIACDDTYANQIKRLHGGNYVVATDNGIEVKTYHRFEAHPERLSMKTESELIDMIDHTFRQAVQMEWEKDIEYGYLHLADLSGGLDSRMNLWVAHEMKDLHATVLTYSKVGELDEIISKQIASYWYDELLFKPLDDISFMEDVSENTELLGGLSLFSGITGGKRLLESLDLSRYGIEHTGMVGDVTLGSFYRSKDEIIGKMPTGRYSERLSEKLPDRVKKLFSDYEDYEVYLMYVRGFHGACNSHLIRRNYTEVGSPFLNVEFMQLCYDIPVKKRMNHNIYKKWIKTKYPQAAQFKWEKLGGKITESPVRSKIRIIMKRGPRKLIRMMGIKTKDKHGMNPIDYLLSKNSRINAYLDEYEKQGINKWRSILSKELIHDLDWLYNTGNAWEKSMALTVLASAEMYFGEKENGESGN